MKDLIFWNNWHKYNKITFNILLGLFLLSLIFYTLAYFLGESIAISFSTVKEFETLKVIVDEFTRALLTFSVDADTYITKQRFYAEEIQLYPITTYTYITFVFIGLLFLLTIITYLELILYVGGMLIFLVFLVTMNTELLNIFGSQKNVFVIVLFLLYGGTSYYFYAFNKNFGFVKRLLTFALITIIAAVTIGFGSSSSHPFVFIANFSLVIPILLTIVFIITVAFDIVHAFLYITTLSKSGAAKNSLINFSIITFLYFINLLLLLLKKMLYIDWDILYLHPLLILPISAVIGIYAVRQRASLSSKLISYNPLGAFFYLGLGIIAFATIGYALITYNHPLIEAFEYAIIYTHLGFGFIYFLYVLINFGDYFSKGLPIYRVVYQPRRAPFFLVRGIGLVIALALLFRSNAYAYNLALSGYYNAGGDAYTIANEPILAKEYYINGVRYEYQNPRSNYSVAFLAQKEGDNKTAQEYYTRSLIKHPTVQAYVNLSNIYFEENMLFPAIFTLKDALKSFPESDIVYNNLGILYNETKLLDSTVYYLSRAKDFASYDEKVTITNLIGILSKKGFLNEADSIANAYSYESDLPFINNKLAVSTRLGKELEKPFTENFIKDTTLTRVEFAYLNNYILNKLKTNDTIALAKVTELSTYDSNKELQEELNLLEAYKSYYVGDRANAKRLLDNLKNFSSSPQLYSKILGRWMLELNQYELATEYFKDFRNLPDIPNKLNLAIAYLGSGTIKDGLEVLDELKGVNEEGTKEIINDLLLIFSTNEFTKVMSWEGPLRYKYLYYKKQNLSNEQLSSLFQSFKDPTLKTLAGADLMNHYINNNNSEEAAAIWNVINQESSAEEQAIREANFQHLRLLQIQQKWEELSTVLPHVAIPEERKTDVNLFKAQIAEAKSDSTTASNLYKEILDKDPFAEEAILSAVKFFNKKGKDLYAYDKLLEALKLNPVSKELQVAYFLQSLELNLISYAETALKDVQPRLKDTEYTTYKKMLDSAQSDETF